MWLQENRRHLVFFFSTFPPRLWYVALFSHQLQLRQSFGLENVLSFLFEIENSSFFSSQWSLLIFFRSHWLHTAFSVATGEVIFFFFYSLDDFYSVLFITHQKWGSILKFQLLSKKKTLSNFGQVLVWKCISSWIQFRRDV